MKHEFTESPKDNVVAKPWYKGTLNYKVDIQKNVPVMVYKLYSLLSSARNVLFFFMYSNFWLHNFSLICFCLVDILNMQ